MKLSQHGNVDKVLDTYLGTLPSKKATTPYLSDSGINKDKHPEPVLLSTSEHNLYQRIVGSLLYLSINTRGDLLPAVHCLTRKMAAPNTYSMLQARRVLAYLQGTKSYKMVFDGNEDTPVIYGWADSSFNSGVGDRKSQYGYCFAFGLKSAMFINVCRRSTIIAQSSTEAEYYGLAEASRELLWIRNFLLEIEQSQVHVKTIYQDNTTTIKIATTETVTDRSKHIDVKYHFVKSLCFDGLINVEYMATADMVADIFTKVLLDGTFSRHAKRLLGIW